MKKLLLTALLLLCALALAGCSGNQSETQRYQVVGEVTQAPAVATQIPEGVAEAEEDVDPFSEIDAAYDYDNGDYDPTSEDDKGTGDLVFNVSDSSVVVAEAATAAPTVNSEYAGATPVVIDPIDKPTATPVPPITFTFVNYDATKLHLAFEAPAGWTVDDVQSDTYVLTNPDTSADYQASITVRAIPVTSDYNHSQLVSEVKSMLSSIGSEFSDWSPSKTADRTLLDKSGVYANYTATKDGAQVAGRVHVTCIGKTLYTVHFSYPRAYRDTYADNVITQFRKTITITQ